MIQEGKNDTERYTETTGNVRTKLNIRTGLTGLRTVEER